MRYLLDCFREAWKEARPGGCKKAAECLFEQNLYFELHCWTLIFRLQRLDYYFSTSEKPILFVKATMSIQRNSEGDGPNNGRASQATILSRSQRTGREAATSEKARARMKRAREGQIVRR